MPLLVCFLFFVRPSINSTFLLFQFLSRLLGSTCGCWLGSRSHSLTQCCNPWKASRWHDCSRTPSAGCCSQFIHQWSYIRLFLPCNFAFDFDQSINYR